MAITLVSSRTVNFDDRLIVQTDSVEVSVNRGYKWIVRTTPETLTTTVGYVNVFGVINYVGFEVETPLCAKFFPKGRGMVFGVPVPRITGSGQNVQLSVLLQPKEIFPGRNPQRQLDLQIFWDDQGDVSLSQSLSL